MLEVIILTGTCGVGKSTIAKQWAADKKGAIVDCDQFLEWIYNNQFKNHTQQDELFLAELASGVTNQYLNKKLSVAIAYVWSPAGIEVLMKHLRSFRPTPKIKIIWLYCDPSENHRRDALRTADNQMKSRLDVVFNNLTSYNWPDYVSKINTTNQCVEESIKSIEKLPALKI